jgi:hypothetical protein
MASNNKHQLCRSFVFGIFMNLLRRVIRRRSACCDLYKRNIPVDFGTILQSDHSFLLCVASPAAWALPVPMQSARDLTTRVRSIPQYMANCYIAGVSATQIHCATFSRHPAATTSSPTNSNGCSVSSQLHHKETTTQKIVGIQFHKIRRTTWSILK